MSVGIYMCSTCIWVQMAMSSGLNGPSFSHKNGWRLRLWVQNSLSACVIYRWQREGGNKERGWGAVHWFLRQQLVDSNGERAMMRLRHGRCVSLSNSIVNGEICYLNLLNVNKECTKNSKIVFVVAYCRCDQVFCHACRVRFCIRLSHHSPVPPIKKCLKLIILTDKIVTPQFCFYLVCCWVICGLFVCCWVRKVLIWYEVS